MPRDTEVIKTASVAVGRFPDGDGDLDSECYGLLFGVVKVKHIELWRLSNRKSPRSRQNM